MAILHGKEKRDALHAAKAAVRELEKPDREARKIATAKAKAARERRVGQREEGQRDPRKVDERFAAWIRTLPCIACRIEGAPANPGPVEAAHQKLAIAGKGWREGGLGPRVHDARCAPLCVHHHRGAANSCDTGGQRKFWDRLGIGDDIADLCRALYAAFKAGESGLDILPPSPTQARGSAVRGESHG